MSPAENTGGAGQRTVGSLAAERPTVRGDLCVELRRRLQERAAMATWASAGNDGSNEATTYHGTNCIA